MNWDAMLVCGAKRAMGNNTANKPINPYKPDANAWLDGWAAAILGYPAAVSVPLAFGLMYAVSKATARSVPSDVGSIFTRLHAPERLGVGRDREREL